MKALLPLLPLLIVACASPQGHMQASTNASGQHTTPAIVVVDVDDVAWADHPFVGGAKMCVQSGDPATGSSVLMMRFPKGLTVPAHWHTSDETVTVVQGSARLGSGEIVDEKQGVTLGVGGYMVIPGRSPHWAIAKEDFVITVALNGPADFHLCAEHR